MARMRTGGALAIVVVTTFATIVATAVPASAAFTCDDGAFAPEHEYSINYGESLWVLKPGLLDGAEGRNVLVQTDWGIPGQNPTPSDTESFWAAVPIEYINDRGANSRAGGFRYKPDYSTFEFSGIDQFDYSIINDCFPDNYSEDFNTVSITVKPIVTNDSYNMLGDTTLSTDATNDVFKNDVAVDTLSVDFDGTSAQGGDVSPSLASDGAFDFTPAAGFMGVDTFKYRVWDLNADLEYEGTVTVNVGPSVTPAAPTGVTAKSPGDHRAVVTWVAANGNGNPIDQYRITSSPGGVTKTVGGTATSATVTGLTNGTPYTFTVRSSTVAGDSAESASSNAVTPRTVPGKPTSVKGSAAGSKITVTWAAPPTNGAPVTESIAIAKPGNKIVKVSGAGRTATFTGMTPGSYSFYVKSRNAAGYGAYSAASPATIVAQTLPTYTARYSEKDYAYLVKTAAHFGLRVQDVGKTGVAVIRYILAISQHPATRAAAKPANNGTRAVSATYSLADNASTMVPVSHYLVLNGNDTLYVGSALMMYFAALRGVR
jgi:hypothetical protein